MSEWDSYLSRSPDSKSRLLISARSDASDGERSVVVQCVVVLEEDVIDEFVGVVGERRGGGGEIEEATEEELDVVVVGMSSECLVELCHVRVISSKCKEEGLAMW